MSDVLKTMIGATDARKMVTLLRAHKDFFFIFELLLKSEEADDIADAIGEHSAVDDILSRLQHQNEIPEPVTLEDLIQDKGIEEVLEQLDKYFTHNMSDAALASLMERF